MGNRDGFRIPDNARLVPMAGHEMTQVEKLEALVRRAVENDYKPQNFAWIPEDEKVLLDYWLTADNYKAVIFNHDFARALFPLEGFRVSPRADIPNTPTHNGSAGVMKVNSRAIKGSWQYHLQQAVVSDDPIGYMYKVVFGATLET